MNCSDCQTPMEAGIKSCKNCGRIFSFEELTAYQLEANKQKKQSQGKDIHIDAPPDLTDRIAIFQKIAVETHSKEKLPSQLEWLNRSVNLVISHDALVVMASSPRSQIENSIDVMAAFGSSSLGAAMLTLPVALVADAYTAFNKNKGLDKNSLMTLFKSGNAIWINKSSAKFYIIESQGGLIFGNPGCIIAANGNFKSAIGQIQLCIAVSDAVVAFASEYRKAFNKTGFDFINISVKDYSDMRDALKIRLEK